MATHDVPWWKRTTVYQIYPRSFADSNGDGIGDLRGILHRLDYLRALGVETLWISPFFESPQADFGYDVSDHFGVAPEYGWLEDVRRLVDETHARGMKIVFDMARELRALCDEFSDPPRFWWARCSAGPRRCGGIAVKKRTASISCSSSRRCARASKALRFGR